MKLLADSDAFCKLGAAGFLQEAARIFEADLRECGRLVALPHMLRKGRLRKLFGAEACDALICLAHAMPVLHQPSLTWLDKLTRIEAIDPGEAQIFAAAAECGITVISGDKRALRALKAVEAFAEALAGRIVVLEAALLALCEQLGPEEVRRRIAPVAASDKMVAVCFSPGERDPRGALLSYYKSFASDVEPLVLWDPKIGGAT